MEANTWKEQVEPFLKLPVGWEQIKFRIATEEKICIRPRQSSYKCLASEVGQNELLSKGSSGPTYPNLKASLQRIKLFLRNLAASQEKKSQKYLKEYEKKKRKEKSNLAPNSVKLSVSGI